MPADASSQRPGEDDANAFRKALNGRGERIFNKFEMRRAHDIRPDFLQETLGDIKGLSQSLTSPERSDIKSIRNLEDQIYAAMSLYDEPENREKYFARLRIVADQLKRI